MAGGVLGLAILVFLPGSLFPSPAPVAPASAKAPTSALSRITFSDETSNLQAIDAGRFESYRKAMAVIGKSAFAGNGLGQLVLLGTNSANSAASRPGWAPGVDDAYLTMALKAGILGLVAFAAMMLIPLQVWGARLRRRRWAWFLPAWLGLMILTVTQSYATSGYGPFALALLLALPLAGYRLGAPAGHAVALPSEPATGRQPGTLA